MNYYKTLKNKLGTEDNITYLEITTDDIDRKQAGLNLTVTNRDDIMLNCLLSLVDVIELRYEFDKYIKEVMDEILEEEDGQN